MADERQWVNRFQDPQGNEYFYEDAYARERIPKLQDGLVAGNGIEIKTNTKEADTDISIKVDGTSIDFTEDGKLKAVASISFKVENEGLIIGE